MNVELYCDKAPRTCYNFLTLAKSGKYDSTIFHRLIPGFMVQGLLRSILPIVPTEAKLTLPCSINRRRSNRDRQRRREHVGQGVCG